MITRIPGVASEFLPDVLSTLDELESRYPGIPHSLTAIWPWEMKADPTATAETDPSKGDIYLNRMMFDNPKLFWMGVNAGTTVTKNAGDVIRHEFGHVLTPHAKEDDLVHVLDALSKRVMPFVDALPKNLSMQMIEKNLAMVKTFPISFYAVTGGPIEAIAECFCKLDRGDNDAAIAALAFGRLHA